MLVFALLVFGTMKFIWPHILNAMEERSRKIAQRLAAAEQGEQELAEARGKAATIRRRGLRRGTRPRASRTLVRGAASGGRGGPGPARAQAAGKSARDARAARAAGERHRGDAAWR